MTANPPLLPGVGELLPRASEAFGVHAKLATYSLDVAHEYGGPKARGFETILGITIEAIDYLEAQIMARLLDTPITVVSDNPPPRRQLHRRYAHSRDRREGSPSSQRKDRLGGQRRRHATAARDRLREGLNWRTMATVKQTIGEVDIVAFLRPVAKVESVGTWPAGTKGTVVSDYGNRKMVEISNDRGETLDLPVVPVEQLRLIAKHSLVDTHR